MPYVIRLKEGVDLAKFVEWRTNDELRRWDRVVVDDSIRLRPNPDYRPFTVVDGTKLFEKVWVDDDGC